MHEEIVLVVSLLAGVIALASIAPVVRIPFPILLVLGGLGVSFIPGLPRVVLDPDIVFLLFLPPILYSAAWNTSWRDFRRSLRPILLLAIGLVLLTTVTVAAVAHAFIPGMTWPVAFVLGAIVSPPDAVAATAVLQRLGIPHRIITVLEGESLINDATALVALRFAIAAVMSGSFSLADAGIQFFVVSLGGIAVGLILAVIMMFVHRKLDSALIEIPLTLLTAFAAYIIAEELHVSGVLATVVCGLFLSYRSYGLLSPATRLQSYAVWDTIIFVLNGLVFVLIGLQLPTILASLGDGARLDNLIGYGLLISLTVIIIRFIWVFPATYIPRFLSAKLRARDPYPGWRNVIVISWTGLRGVVSLAAAFAIPLTIENGQPFPQRNLILFLTFCVILVTLVFQGLTLPVLIRFLGLEKDNTIEREEQHARGVAAKAAITRIEMLREEEWAEEELVDHIKEHYQERIQSIKSVVDCGGQTRNFDSIYNRLQLEAIQSERNALVDLRNTSVINDETLRVLEHELDLDEQRVLSRRQGFL